MHVPTGILAVALLAVALLALAAVDGNAAVAHKWLDTDGVTHYSDAPPPTPTADFERLDLPTAPSRAAVHDAYYSIANQWRRMHRERIELERVRAESLRDTRVESRGSDTIVIQVPDSRPSVAILPRHRPGFVSPKAAAPPARRHPLAIPGRDWPVGLNPGRTRLRGGFEMH